LVAGGDDAQCSSSALVSPSSAAIVSLRETYLHARATEWRVEDDVMVECMSFAVHAELRLTLATTERFDESVGAPSNRRPRT